MANGWHVEYVELSNTKPFEEFVLGLPLKERAKVFETINYFWELKNQNLPIKENLSKHLEAGIFELRISLPNKITRILYFYQRGSKIVITHGFIKKSPKTPRKEIQKAIELRELYLKRSNDDEL
ncbi:MAG: type II toxin-antitoxin system RelE/ParE family toxin [candidate division KSB1 bacterium]|nr:type II toxin-antitoxin system RelE/ParE family toxin [candidate division KSB1 bacterium]